MKRILVSLVIFAAISAICHGQSNAATPVKVVGDRVNLRARPDFNAEVVGQIGRDQVLMAKSFQDEWVEVVAPDSVDVWVHKDFVSDNRVSAERLYVRGGPGINWQSVGQMVRDEPIVVRGEFGDWLKIAPGPNCSLWVSRKYVEVIQPEKPVPPKPPQEPPVARVATKPPAEVATAGRSAPAPAVSSAETVVEVQPPVVVQAVEPAASDVAQPVPPDLKLIPLEGQGRRVQREGVLRLAGFVIGRPSRYRLARQEGDRIQTLCYVRGNNSQLASMLGRRVLIRGREYWVRGVKDPVLIPEEIIPYSRP